MFYAAQAPRGFNNEIVVHAFVTKAQRDEWVENNQDADDGACHAYVVDAKRAHRIIGYRGDAATQSFNAFVRHDGPDSGGSAGWEYADAWAA